MNVTQVGTANLIGFISALFTLGGVTGITSADIGGFVNTVMGLVTLGCFVWAHLAHKQALAQASS